MYGLCPPAFIYVIFALVQILIDTFQGAYNTALLKSFIMVIITILLNTLCKNGMGIISWIIVFIPFIFMSVIVTIMLYLFGLHPNTGFIINTNNVNKTNTNQNQTNTTNKSIKYMDVSYAEAPLEISSDPQVE